MIYNFKIGETRTAGEEDRVGGKMVWGHDECDSEVGDVGNRGCTMLAW